jgi:hypothetical protein
MAGVDTLGSARKAYERRAWSDAYAHPDSAHRPAPLAVDDLNRLGTAAHLTGRWKLGRWLGQAQRVPGCRGSCRVHHAAVRPATAADPGRDPKRPGTALVAAG